MQKYLLATLLAIILIGIMIIATPQYVPPAQVSSVFVYSFNATGTLQEAGSMDQTSSPYWWLNSGGELFSGSYVGETIQGDDPITDRWRTIYATNNPVDTDNGLHPQNLFRLVSRSTWNNVSMSAKFYIAKDNLSLSPNRNASNGLLLMSRYTGDGKTLYYAGIRVDGTAVIKKKYQGVYSTMAQTKIFPGTYSGFVDNINLLPHNEWVTLRSDTITSADGSTTVTLYMMRAGQTTWTKLLQATDHGQYNGTPPISGPGYAGIRTDFMDVEFQSVRLQAV